VARALTLAPANIVTPFQYFQLIASVIVGYVGFGDLPDALTWLGAGVIMASGIAMGFSQTRAERLGFNGQEEEMSNVRPGAL
jgi:drug/metabolite transporter (DMT)-like permease